MKCEICGTKMIRENLNMTTFVGSYKYAYYCPNECKKSGYGVMVAQPASSGKVRFKSYRPLQNKRKE